MCLTPDNTFHSVKYDRMPGTDYPTSNQSSHVLKRPILVIKGLRTLRTYRYLTNSYQWIFRSPYWDHSYQLGKAVRGTGMLPRIRYNQSVSKGIHALRSQRRFTKYFHTRRGLASIADRSNFTFEDGELYPFPAVIPAGARIWIGKDGDIAASKMTVYRDMEAVREAFGSIDAPIKVQDAF